MKRLLYFFLPVILSVTSCVEKESIMTKDVLVNIVAELDSPTKASVINGGAKVLWERSDSITILSGQRVNTYPAVEPDVNSSHVPYISSVTLHEVNVPLNQPIYGLYPGTEDASIDVADHITTTLSASQTCPAGSFDKHTHILVAKQTTPSSPSPSYRKSASGVAIIDIRLPFMSVCGGIRFSLKNDNIKRISFEGMNNESLAGRISINVENKEPDVDGILDPKGSIVVKPFGSKYFCPGYWYFIETIPVELSDGFRVKFYTDDQVGEIVSNQSIQIKRSTYLSISSFDDNAVFVNREKDIEPDSGIITFKDSVVKAGLVSAFDTNQDGEISREEAASVNDFSSVFYNIENGWFSNHPGYKFFDELQFFSGLTSIPASRFDSWDELSSIILPDSIKSIGSAAFTRCYSLKSIVLPKAVETIGDYAFQDCCSLTSVEIPESVNYIGEYAFNGCDLLSLFGGNSHYISKDRRSLIDISNNTLIVAAPYGLASFSVPDGIINISPGAFSHASSLISVSLPSSIRSIGDSAFDGCSSLLSIDLPNSVFDIGRGAFSGCSSLSTISIPEDVTIIEDQTFNGCSSLKEIIVPKGVERIGHEAFKNCVELSSVSLPNTLTSIGFSAFCGCANLKQFSGKFASSDGRWLIKDNELYSSALCGVLNASIPDGVSIILSYACCGFSEVEQIDIPESVTTIGFSAFWRCSGLKSLVIPSQVTKIDSGAFEECTGLTSIEFKSKTPPSIGKAFNETNNCTIYVPAESFDEYVKALEGPLYGDTYRIKAKAE